MNIFNGTQSQLDEIATYFMVVFTFPGYPNTYAHGEGVNAMIRKCIARRCRFRWEGLTQKEFEIRMTPHVREDKTA